jgi:ABC-type multidrug transport system fused ATPase/permease subunit
MENVPSGFEGWLWWIISVVVVGILINLVSSFLYPKVEKQFAKFSETRRKELEESKLTFLKKIEQLKANPSELLALKIDLILLYLRAVVTIVIGLIVLTAIPLVFEVFFNLFRFYLAINVNFLITLLLTLIVFLIMTILLPQLNEGRYIRSLLRAVSENSPKSE